MTRKSGIARISGQQLTHQERINIEMFRAIEALGRKLERAEYEGNHLTRRLVQIESSATVDEKTGKLYLPVVAGQTAPQVIERAPKWQSVTSLMSSALALAAISLVLFREPVPVQQLTASQLAALDSLAHSRFASLDNNRWKPLDAETARDTVNAIDTSKFIAPEDVATAETPTAPATSQVAEAAPSPQELAAIEPAAGESAAAAETAPEPVVEAPVEVKPVAQAKPPVAPKKEVPAKKLAADKPLPKPANKYAPIPLTETAEATQPAPAAETTQAALEAPVAKPAAKPVEVAMATPSVVKPVVKPVAPVAKPRVVFGVDPDKALPTKLSELEKRAFEGTAEAQHDLATIYASGKLVAQDYKRAVFWFSQAADRGVGNADYNLGVMFQQGLGVRQDVNKALGWYEKAAELGHPEAMYNLGIAYIEGIGTPRNIAKGVASFKQAANAGVAQAAYNLGVLYESNFVGPIDLAKASEWYQVAANEGHQEAKQAIARLKSGIGDTFEGNMASKSAGGEDKYGAADAAAAESVRDTGLTLAKNVEPAAGGDDEAGYGEGDQSPLDEKGRALAPGFGDDLVRKIQEALITRGELPPNTTTGYMTPQTEDAIRAWQKSLGWTADGKPSRELLEKLTVKK